MTVATAAGRELVPDFKVKIAMDRNLQPEHLGDMNNDRLQTTPPNSC